MSFSKNAEKRAYSRYRSCPYSRERASQNLGGDSTQYTFPSLIITAPERRGSLEVALLQLAARGGGLNGREKIGHADRGLGLEARLCI